MAEFGDDGGRCGGGRAQVEPRGGRGQAHAGVVAVLRNARIRRGRGRGRGCCGRRGGRYRPVDGGEVAGLHVACLPGSSFDAHPTAAGGEHANDLAVVERGDDGGRRRRRGTQVEPRRGRGQTHAGVGSALRRRARRGRGRCGGGRRGRRGRRGQHDDALQPAQIVCLHIADLPLNRFHARPATLVGEYLHIVAVAQLVDDGGGGGGRRTQVEPRRSVGERHAGERTVGPGFQRRHGGLRRGRRGGRGSGRRRRRGRGRGSGRGRRGRRGPCRRVGGR